MHGKLDPRAWNLVTGVALLTAGCGARVAGTEAAGTDESDESVETVDTSESVETETETGPEPECVSSEDCPDYYYCEYGECVYSPHSDGWRPYYECDFDTECGEYEFCEWGYCETLGPPPPNCAEQGLEFSSPVPLPVEGVLALTFADVDDDGRDELVVATPTEFLVYESVDMAPTVSPREPGDNDRMIAGEFDALPGEDLILWADGSLQLYSSNGDGSFAAAVSSPSPIGLISRMLAADLDGQPPTDMIGWGSGGVFIERGGEVLEISTQQYGPGGVHGFGSIHPSFGLWREGAIVVYELDGDEIGEFALKPGPASIATITRGSNEEYINLVHHIGWSEVDARGLGGSTHQWPVVGNPVQVFAGNFHGDVDDDLLLFRGGSNAAIELNPGGPGDCWHDLPLSVRGQLIRAAIGDHDGDGHDELAILTELGEVVLFDAS